MPDGVAGVEFIICGTGARGADIKLLAVVGS